LTPFCPEVASSLKTGPQEASYLAFQTPLITASGSSAVTILVSSFWQAITSSMSLYAEDASVIFQMTVCQNYV